MNLPTEAQIKAAQKFGIAKEYRNFIETEFETLKNEILQSGSYHYDDLYYTDKWKERGLHLPEDRVIRQSKDLDLISGEGLKGKNGYNQTDSHKFFIEFNRRIIAAGFKYRGAALIKAEQDVLHCQKELIKATESFHGLSPAEVFFLKDKTALMADILSYIGPELNDPSYQETKRLFFNQRMYAPLPNQNHGYSRNMESFKKFQELKKMLTVEEFIENTHETHEEGYYDSVETVYEYEEGYYLYAIKDNEQWQYSPSRACRKKYITLFDGDKFYENNELEDVERALFTYFLSQNRRLNF